MFFVLSANNTDTNISIKGVSTCKDGAWASMYDAFVAGLKEAFPNRTPPSAEEAEKGWEYDLYSSRASITEDGASIYDGDDMTYYSIVEHDLPLYGLTSDYCDGRTLDSVITVFLGKDAAMEALEREIQGKQAELGIAVTRGKNGAHFDDGLAIQTMDVAPLEIYG